MTAKARKAAAPPQKTATPAAGSQQGGFAGRQAEEYTPPITAEPRGGPIPAWTGGSEDDPDDEDDSSVRAATALPGSAGQIQQQWEQARADMLAAWPATAQPMVDELATQAESAVEAGDLGALGTLAVSAGVIAAMALMLAGGAVGLAGEAAAGVVAEAASHRVDITAPDEPGAERVRQTADAIAGIIAAGYASGAARAALHVAGADPAEVRAAVERHLDGLSAAERGMVADQLGALLSAAQHAGRLAAFERLPPATRYRAVEESDASKCEPCDEVSDREYRNLRAGLADYPVMGYRECAGGARCRGGLHPIWPS